MNQTGVVMQIKPDGVQRSLVGEIIRRFEQKGFYLRGLKYKNVEKELAEEHYVDLSSKPFYRGLVEYIIRYASQELIDAKLLYSPQARGCSMAKRILIHYKARLA